MNQEIKQALVFTDASNFVSFIEKQKRFSKKVSLENMKYFSSLFNHPEQKLNFIHITGTNGKGSTVAYLKNIYLKQGLNVGTFTSPYIECFNERISYNGKNITDDELLKYGNLILSKYPKMEQDGMPYPTFFEFITLLALIYFASITEIDLVLFEVGIGGRLDATNIITPIVSVITNVSYDHTTQLGNTLELITKEKLGIVKPNIPLVTSCKNQKLLKIMEEDCMLKHSMFIKVDFERLKIKKLDLDSSVFSYADYELLFQVKMLGLHQIENACLAIEIVNLINKIYQNKKSNFCVSSEILYEGLISTSWIGRLECISKAPLIYLDGGHNIDCIKRVCEFVKQIKCNHKRVVVSISSDKDLKEMINLLDQTFDELIFTNYTYNRSAHAEDLYHLSQSQTKKLIVNIEDSIDYCFNRPTDFTLFTGSLYLISEIRPKILNRKN